MKNVIGWWRIRSVVRKWLFALLNNVPSFPQRAYEAKKIRVRLHETMKIVPRGRQMQREVLDMAELLELLRTPLEPIRNWQSNTYDLCRQIVYFDVLMGFGSMELRRLNWEDITDLPGGWAKVRYWRQKTKQWIDCYMPVDARRIIGERGVGPVWPYIPDQSSLNRALHLWCQKAGIQKNITMHCLRHTFATLQLAADTPLHVVSSMLGHARISTTQIYTRTLDQDLAAAAGRIVVEPPIQEPTALRLVRGEA